jgi:hypothetical protein
VSTFTERLKEAMAARFMGVRELDRAILKKEGYTSTLIGRGSIPRGKNLRAIAEALCVHPEWLRSGEGPRDDEELLAAYEAANAPEVATTSRAPAATSREAMALVWRLAHGHAGAISLDEAEVIAAVFAPLLPDLPDLCLQVLLGLQFLDAAVLARTSGPVTRASLLAAFVRATSCPQSPAADWSSIASSFT